MTAAGPPPPDLSPEQRAAAAARGVRARQVRAELRTGLGEGRIRVGDLVRDSQVDDERGRTIARMRVVDLLSSFPGIGPVRAATIMSTMGIAANRRVGGLGARQVEQLTAMLSARYPESHP